ncbi:MAG: hypothetical protein HOE64_15900 [Nitrospina sp.]|nr:hypothetical protein [Nitrospina sp.]
MRNFLATFLLMSLWVVSSAGAQGTINNSSIGLTTPQAGTFTNLEATTQIKLGADTVTDFDDLDSETVKSSATDSTAGFLTDELQAGTNVTISEIDVGGNKKVSLSVADKLTTKGDVLYHNGTIETRLGVGASGQILTSDTSGSLLWANPAEGDQSFNSNVLLNSYRIGENLNLPALKMLDGAVDAFTDATGVDATASTNESFDSSNDLYKPTASGATTFPMIKFNGTNYLSRVATSDSDTKVGTISFLFRPNHDFSVQRDILSHNAGFVNISTSTQARFRIRLLKSTGAAVLDLLSTKTLVQGTLYHIVASWDLATSAVHVYIDGVDDSPSIINNVNDFVDYSRATSEIATDSNLNGTSAMEIGNFYFNRSQYVDISIAANLAKFIDSRGNPVDLGSDGSTPTGTAPEVFLNNAVSTFQNNLGSGGNYTVTSGALTAGTPSTVSSSGTPDNLTLISNSQTAKTEPNGANILLLAEDVGADITLNTDLKASVSRDGGTTFSQVTLSDSGEFEKGNLLTGTVDLSSQPTGTDMEWKVETLNNKDLNLHGVGLEWR